MLDDYHKHLALLKPLADAGIPVLWRPLHEIDGGWFWWTCPSKPERTAELWRILFRETYAVHGYHNLIWVWSSSEKNPFRFGLEYRKKFYPGSQFVDIIGVDLYRWDYEHTGTRKYWGGYASYRDLFEMVRCVDATKMVSLSECQALPNPSPAAKDAGNFAPWLYAMPWHANSKANPCGWIDTTYNHDYYLTADEF